MLHEQADVSLIGTRGEPGAPETGRVSLTEPTSVAEAEARLTVAEQDVERMVRQLADRDEPGRRRTRLVAALAWRAQELVVLTRYLRRERPAPPPPPAASTGIPIAGIALRRAAEGLWARLVEVDPGFARSEFAASTREVLWPTAAQAEAAVGGTVLAGKVATMADQIAVLLKGNELRNVGRCSVPGGLLTTWLTLTRQLMPIIRDARR